jgi:hypothetical protein
MKTQINCYIDVELAQLVRDNGLEFSKLLEFGIKFKMAEDHLGEYPANSLINKIAKYQEALCQEQA